jgi:hypothetical protein
MPVKQCQLGGSPGYKWGSEGKCYTYTEGNEGSKKKAKKAAIVQGLAIGDVQKMDVNKEQFAETYNDYPKAATENAKKALGWIEKYGRNNVDAGTLVGLARANQLANGENLSRDTIARMASFNRHRKNAQISPQFKGTPWMDRGYVAWLLWGGTEGVDWAIRKLEQIDNQKFHKQNIIDVIDAKALGISIKDLGITEEQLNDSKYQHQLDINEFDNGDKVSFDYDGTLSTDRGKEMAKREIAAGSTVYIISARSSVEGMLGVADRLGIPHSRVYATGSNKAKVEKIKSLGIDKHIDNNPDVTKELPSVGRNFETMEFASLVKLYRYTSNDYASGIGPNSRSFCVQLVGRTKLSLMRFEDIVALNSAQPGMGKGGSDSYSVFNYRGGSNCKHIWVKYLFDPQTFNLVKAPVGDQPKNGPIE